MEFKNAKAAEIGDFIVIVKSLYIAPHFPVAPSNGSVGRIIDTDDTDDFQHWLVHFPHIADDNNVKGTWWMAAEEFLVLDPAEDLHAEYMLGVMKQ